MLTKNKLLWDCKISHSDWRFQRICRLGCLFGFHLAAIGNLYGKDGLMNCAHCGAVLIRR